MKTVKYFFVSFLVVMLLCVSVLAIGQVVDPEPALSSKEKIFGFFKDIDGLNIILLIFATFAGGMWGLLRMKLKQLSDFFLELYVSTDESSPGGKKVIYEEREKIVSRLLAILNKSTVTLDAKKIAQFKNEAKCKNRNG